MSNNKSGSRDYQVKTVEPFDRYWEPGTGNWQLLTDELKATGYWTVPGHPAETGSFEDGFIMPHPRDAVDASWDESERLKVIDYLDAGHPFLGFMGGLLVDLDALMKAMLLAATT